MKKTKGVRESDLLQRFKKAVSNLKNPTVREACDWLDANDPRKDKRSWRSNMVILGGFAVYLDGSLVRTDNPKAPRPFVKITHEGVRPAKFRLNPNSAKST